jgi:hypothetical protein
LQAHPVKQPEFPNVLEKVFVEKHTSFYVRCER